ncbi:hypothetical protein J3456_09550, partial [Sulfitobacter sp. NFXS29]|uniref:hypothetical protein n=1 Tax=Sulfitobacter sp. NFXS29 TaxID=2818438 RepID=UPI0032DF06EE
MDGLHMPANDRGHSASVNRTASHIESVSRSLGYCLHLEDTNAWLGFGTILRARLNTRERLALAYVALRALPTHHARSAAETAISAGAGQPISPLFN